MRCHVHWVVSCPQYISVKSDLDSSWLQEEGIYWVICVPYTLHSLLFILTRGTHELSCTILCLTHRWKVYVCTSSYWPLSDPILVPYVPLLCRADDMLNLLIASGSHLLSFVITLCVHDTLSGCTVQSSSKSRAIIFTPSCSNPRFLLLRSHKMSLRPHGNLDRRRHCLQQNVFLQTTTLYLHVVKWDLTFRHQNFLLNFSTPCI